MALVNLTSSRRVCAHIGLMWGTLPRQNSCSPGSVSIISHAQPEWYLQFNGKTSFFSVFPLISGFPLYTTQRIFRILVLPCQSLRCLFTSLLYVVSISKCPVICISLHYYWSLLVHYKKSQIMSNSFVYFDCNPFEYALIQCTLKFVCR